MNTSRSELGKSHVADILSNVINIKLVIHKLSPNIACIVNTATHKKAFKYQDEPSQKVPLFHKMNNAAPSILSTSTRTM